MYGVSLFGRLWCHLPASAVILGLCSVWPAASCSNYIVPEEVLS